MAVKLVIEPIFEADFEDCSFGFRPKRDAHQAVEAVRQALYRAHPYVLDADLQQYFDTIAHDKLMEVIAGRISDRHILNWIKQWLSAAVVEEDRRRKAANSQARARHAAGRSDLPVTGQHLSEPIRPDVPFVLPVHGLAAELVRYADDFVILMRGRAKRTREKVQGDDGGAGSKVERRQDSGGRCAPGEL